MSQGTPEYFFVQRMRDERLARGWSQERLAQNISDVTGYRLNPTVITKLEWALDPQRADKARGLGLNEALFICDALRVSLKDMATPEPRDESLARKLREVRNNKHQHESLIRGAEENIRERRAEVAQLEEREAELIRSLDAPEGGNDGQR